MKHFFIYTNLFVYSHSKLVRLELDLFMNKPCSLTKYCEINYEFDKSINEMLAEEQF